MSTMGTPPQASPRSDSQPWIKSVEEIDDRWVEVVVVTASGEDAIYVIPKKTGFPDLDRRLSAAQ